MKPTMTNEVKKSAEMLYISGTTNVSEIARILKISKDSLYYWIKSQAWYKSSGTNKSRLQKQLEKLDLSFSEKDFEHHKRKDAPYNVIFPFQVPSLNEYIATINHNKMTGNKFKEGVEDRMLPFICKEFAKGAVPFTCKIQVHITFYESSERRDWDNIMSSQKFIFDALQTAGVIEKDNQAHMLPPTHSFGKDARPHAVVSIYPHPECPVKQSNTYYVPRKKKRNDDAWREMFGEEEIRNLYNGATNKNKQFRIFLDFGVPKKELERILGL
jgi:Holliday junction resolvase RusA-like endonuclease